MLRQRVLPAAAYLTSLALLFALYSWFRKTYFLRPPEVAYEHALQIIDLQRALGIAVTRIELPMQRWALDHAWAIDLANAYYRQMKPALYVAALLCLILAPRAFPRIWRGFLVATVIALPWYALYPLAPPRLMQPYGYQFVDTLAVYGGVQSTAEGLGGANQFAAMPSMHIGWSIFAGLWIAAALPWRRTGAVLGSAHVALMSVAVVLTANHYVLDIIAGVAVAAAGFWLSGLIPEGFSRMMGANVRSLANTRRIAGSRSRKLRSGLGRGL